MGQSEIAIVRPQRVVRNIGDDDLLAPVDGCAARTNARADLHAVNGLAVFSWKRRRSAVPQRLTIPIQQ